MKTAINNASRTGIMPTKNILINKLSKEVKIKDFKKIGLTWLCECNPFVYVINIQPGKYTDEHEEYFTIYIGIYSSKVYSLIWGADLLRKSVKDTDCCLRGVFSTFIKSKEDTFYIRKEIDIGDFKEKIIRLINDNIIRFFKEITTFERLYKIMILYENDVIQKELHQIYIACIEFIMNKKTDALIRLSKVENIVWANKAKEVMKRITNMSNVSD
jgi:hypothetical protein